MSKHSVVIASLCVLALVCLLAGADAAVAFAPQQTGAAASTNGTGIDSHLDSKAETRPDFSRSSPVVRATVPPTGDAMPGVPGTRAGAGDALGFAWGIIAIAIGLVGLLLRRLTLD